MVHALLDEVRALRAAYERRAASNRLTRADRQTLERFLPAVFARTKGSIVLAKEVAWFFAGSKTTKSIGRFLRRVEGFAVNGLMVERAGVENNSTLWRIVLTSPEST